MKYHPQYIKSMIADSKQSTNQKADKKTPITNERTKRRLAGNEPVPEGQEKGHGLPAYVCDYIFIAL